eukprot:gene25288-10941_t
MYNPVPYADLSYTVDANYPAKAALIIEAPTTSLTGIITWSSVPALPSPLAFGTAGGITGTPPDVVPSRGYVVTGTNDAVPPLTKSVTITFGITGKQGLYVDVAHAAHLVPLPSDKASAVGLSLWQVDLPSPCSNNVYARRMKAFTQHAIQAGITHVAFGDLHLADVRAYRETMHIDTPITPLFPIWSSPELSPVLAQTMINSGVQAVVLTVDKKKLPHSFAGRYYNADFLKDLPEGVDHLGEFGEFHTLAIDGPAFAYPIPVSVRETMERENGFVYTEVVLDVEEGGCVSLTSDGAGGAGGVRVAPGGDRVAPKPLPLAAIAVHIDAAAVDELVPLAEWEKTSNEAEKMAEMLCPAPKKEE